MGAKVSKKEVRGHNKFYPVLKGGGGSKKCQTSDFPILLPPPPLPIIKDQSLSTTSRGE